MANAAGSNHLRVKVFASSTGEWLVRAELPNARPRTAPIGLRALAQAARLVQAPELLLDELAKRTRLGRAEPPSAESAAQQRNHVGKLLFTSIFGRRLKALFESWRRDFRSLSPRYGRLDLALEVPELATLPWEWMRGDPPKASWPVERKLVRVVTEPSQVAKERLEPPLHFWQYNLQWPHEKIPPRPPLHDVNVEEILAEAFRTSRTGMPNEEMARVVQASRVDASRPDVLRPRPGQRVDALLISRARASLGDGSPRLILPSDSTAAHQIDILRRAGVRNENLPRTGSHLDTVALCMRLIKMKTRLLVLQPDLEHDQSLWACLLLSNRLAELGGPPVLVSRLPVRSAGAANFFSAFYANLLDDQPIHIARGRAERKARCPGQTVLVLGPADEDLLRLSTLVPRAYRTCYEARVRLQHVDRAIKEIKSLGRHLLADDENWQSVRAEVKRLRSDKETLQQLQGGWAVDWDDTSTSSIPIIRNMQLANDTLAELDKLEPRIKRAAFAADRAEQLWKESQRVSYYVGPPPRKHRPERHVNCWLVDVGSAERVPMKSSIWLERAYQLRLHIGRHSRNSTVKNPLEIPAYALEPLYKEGGGFVQVAVYSHDFLVGNGGEQIEQRQLPAGQNCAMQQLWLPATSDSEPLFFSVTPQHARLSSLRICVYFRNQLLQSLRLDARIRREGALEDQPCELDHDPLQEIPDLDAEDRELLRAGGWPDLETFSRADRKDVLKATGAPVEQVTAWFKAAHRLKKLGYETKIEYTISADFQLLRKIPPRTVTIFTNRLGMTHSIGVKVGGWDEEAGQQDDWTDMLNISPGALAKPLGAVRNRLERISTVEEPGWGGEPESKYRFGVNGGTPGQSTADANRGVEEELKDGLGRLAILGFRLYTAVFSAESQERLARLLQQAGQTIHMARVREGEVLPLSVIYDRYLDVSVVRKDPGQHVCLELLKHTSEDGQLDYDQCIAHDDCPLRGDNPDRCICPWGFWGIKHFLEQPPQLLKRNHRPRELTREIRVPEAAQASMNVSMQLGLLDEHRQRLDSLPTIDGSFYYAGDDDQTPETPGRDQVLAALRCSKWHIIYFYCHGKVLEDEDGWETPALTVGNSESQELVPSVFTKPGKGGKRLYRWPHNPLVFINGCGTVGLEPELMGHFVREFAQNGAAGVIGTEIPIWEELAVFFAEEFFKAFLELQQEPEDPTRRQGKPVGWIMRDLRHQLLRLHNPLGLVYTNYCSADLRVVSDRKSVKSR
jgi:hypothetical protein